MAKYHTKNKAPRFFSFFEGWKLKCGGGCRRLSSPSECGDCFAIFRDGRILSRWGERVSILLAGEFPSLLGKKPSRAAVQKTTPSKEFFIEISLRSCYAF